MYEDAPLAVIKVEVPEQIDAFGTLTVGVLITVTLEVVEDVQVPLLPKIV